MAGAKPVFRHLSRSSAHRRALLRNLVTSLIQHESIATTWHKAKEAQRMAEKLISLGKRNTPAARMAASKHLFPIKIQDSVKEEEEGEVEVEAAEEVDEHELADVAEGTQDRRVAKQDKKSPMVEEAEFEDMEEEEAATRTQQHTEAKTRPIIDKVFNELRERYANRAGGYTRVLRIEPLKEDQAPSALLELVDGPKDMRFAMTALTIAKARSRNQGINDMTAANIMKVTRFRKNGETELEKMAQKFSMMFEAGDHGDEEVKKKRVYPDLEDSR